MKRHLLIVLASLLVISNIFAPMSIILAFGSVNVAAPPILNTSSSPTTRQESLDLNEVHPLSNQPSSFEPSQQASTTCDLEISKVAVLGSPSTPTPGQMVSFTIKVQNVGTGPCPGSTTVTDNMPPALQPIGPVSITVSSGGIPDWQCSPPAPILSCSTNTATTNLPPGYEATFTFQAMVMALPLGIQTITNCANVNNPNSKPTDNKGCVTITFNVITFTVSPTTTLATVTVSPTTTLDTVTLSPTTTLATVTLSPTTTLDTVTVSPTTTLDTVTLSPTTTLATVTLSPTTTLDTVTVTPTITAATVTITSTTTAQDVTVTPTTILDTVTVTPTTTAATVTVTSTTNAPDVTVTQTTTFTQSATVTDTTTATSTASATVTNTATSTASTTVTDTSTNTASTTVTNTATSTVTTTVANTTTAGGGTVTSSSTSSATKCDLAISKTVDPQNAVVGQSIHFSIRIQNTGTEPCPGPTSVTDLQPSGLQFNAPVTISVSSGSSSDWQCGSTILSCNYPGSIPGGYWAMFTFQTTANAAGSITNCAIVNHNADYQSCVTITVTGGSLTEKCELLITKDAKPNPVQSGAAVTIVITVKNPSTVACPGGGPSTPGTSVTDTQPAGFHFNAPVIISVSSGSSSDWQCGSPILSCGHFGPVPAGYSATFTFTATATAIPVGSQATITNCANVSNLGASASTRSCVNITVINPKNPTG